MRFLMIIFAFLLMTMGEYGQDKKWLNSELDMDTRISALIDAMTLEEKISQIVAK